MVAGMYTKLRLSTKFYIEGRMIWLGFRKFLNIGTLKSEESSTNDFVLDLVRIKEGNQLLREEFIYKYTPFILKATSKALGKFVDTKNSDEYSIALSAFNESIDCYDFKKSCNFFLFSQQVIKRRLIDYLRKTSKNKEYPFSYFGEDGYFDPDSISSESYVGFEDIESKEEILGYRQKLEEFGISIMDIVSNVPKHKDSRHLCIRIARMLSEDDELYRDLVKTKNIPRNQLKDKVKVHGRTIGNNRKYIIALCLIFRSNLELSKRYLDNVIEGG